VGVHPALDARLAREARQHVPDVRGVDGPPRQGAEERAAARDLERPAHLKPSAHERDRAGVHPDDAPFVVLPTLYYEHSRVGVEVLGREGERLADPKPAPPEHRHQRAVPHPGRRPPGALPHEELDLRAR